MAEVIGAVHSPADHSPPDAPNSFSTPRERAAETGRRPRDNGADLSRQPTGGQRFTNPDDPREAMPELPDEPETSANRREQSANARER